MKTLIVLSKQFPFGNKEQYIAHELGYLASAFDRVIIYPSDHFRTKDDIAFEMPSNVEVADLNTSLVKVSRLKVMAYFAVSFAAELLRFPLRMHMLRNFARYRAIYATQFVIGETLLQHLRRKGIDPNGAVFYTYWMSASALSLSILKQRGAIPAYVTRAHSVDLYHEQWGLIENAQIPPFRCLKQRMADRIYAISKHGADFLKDIGVEEKKIVVGYLGVDDFGLNPNTRTSIPVLVTCSGADPNKRIHLLGASLARLNQPVKWIHFGDGDLRQLAWDSVKGSCVELDYRGNTPNHVIRSFYQQHHVDLFVMLSQVEGLPVSMMEAMSHGIPVVGTRVNGVPEIVKDGENGKLLPVNFTSEEIDSVLLEFLNNLDAHASWRSNARNMFETRFNASKNYTAFARELSSLHLDGV